MTDSNTVEYCLLVLAGRTGADVTGFNDFDGTMGHMLAERVVMGLALTGKQRRAAHRMLRKYEAQLQRAGVDFGAVAYPEGDAASTVDLKHRLERPRLTVEDARIYVRSPFSLKDVCRGVNGGRWNPRAAPRGAWTYPESPRSAAALLDAFQRYDPVTDEAFQHLIREAERMTAAIAHKDREDLEAIPNESMPSWLHQRQAWWFTRELDAALLWMEMGEHPSTTKALQPDGSWLAWNEVEVGTRLVGSDGRPTTVLEVKPWVDKELCRLHLSDGAVVECSPTHLWSVVAGHAQSVPQTVSTEVIEAMLQTGIRVRLPRLTAVDYPTADLPLDPWLLGYLLGDGCFKAGKVRFVGSGGVLDEVRARLPEGWSFSSESDGVHHVVVSGGQMQAVLRDLDLMECDSRTKFVPQQYLTASISQRWKLLQGLMDADGSKDSGYFATVSKQLALDVQALARSLGGSGSAFTTSYEDEVRVTLGMPPGSKLFLATKGYTPERSHWRHVQRVERTGIVVPQRCVRVDAADHLYVVDGYALTHNTGKSKVTVDLLRESHAQQTLILCPAKVLGVWPKQFRLHGGYDRSDVFHAVNGFVPVGRGRDQRMEADTVENRVRLFDEMLHECTCDRPHVVVANYEITAHEPFRSWALEQEWDYAVADESHRLRAPQGVWSKWATKLRDRSARRLCLTGTALGQGELDIFAQYRFLDQSIFGNSYTSFESRYAVKGGYQGHEVVAMRTKPTRPDRNGRSVENEYYSPPLAREFDEKVFSICYEVGEEVLDLPPARSVTRTFQLTPAARRAYRQLDEDLYTDLVAIDESGGEVSAQNVLVKMLRLQQITGGWITDDDGRETAVHTGKADLLEDVLTDIDPEEQVVVFCRFTKDLDEVERVAGKLRRRYAELSGRREDGLTEDSTLVEGVQVCGVQIQAGGVGVDFTLSCHAVDYSLGFSLIDFRQSRRRLHRPGQERPVLYVRLVAEGTIDVDVYQALERNEDAVQYVAKRRIRDEVGVEDDVDAERRTA